MFDDLISCILFIRYNIENNTLKRTKYLQSQFSSEELYLCYIAAKLSQASSYTIPKSYE